jgi:hypothetical protein
MELAKDAKKRMLVKRYSSLASYEKQITLNEHRIYDYFSLIKWIPSSSIVI